MLSLQQHLLQQRLQYLPVIVNMLHLAMERRTGLLQNQDDLYTGLLPYRVHDNIVQS